MATSSWVVEGEAQGGMEAPSSLSGYAAHNRRVNERWNLAPHQAAACVRLAPLRNAPVKQLQEYLDTHWEADGLKLVGPSGRCKRHLHGFIGYEGTQTEYNESLQQRSSLYLPPEAIEDCLDCLPGFARICQQLLDHARTW